MLQIHLVQSILKFYLQLPFVCVCGGDLMEINASGKIEDNASVGFYDSF